MSDPAPGALRPLHRADELEWAPGRGVLLFSDPKEADRGATLLPNLVCLGWSGVRTDIPLYDWSTISDRAVYVFPPSDGRSQDAVASLTRAHAHFVQLTAPADWTVSGKRLPFLAVSVWSAAEAGAWFAMATQLKLDEYERVRRGEQARQTEVEAAARAALQDPEVSRPNPGELSFSPFFTAPFRILGFADGRYYYLPAKTQQVVSLEPREHSRLNLLALAGSDFWDQAFPGSKTGCDFNNAADGLLRAAESKGYFSASIFRGRGCWVDRQSGANDDVVVFHAGDRLFINRQEYALGVWPSARANVYARGHALEPETAEPADNATASKFADLCSSLQWEAPIYGRLLAGWCVCAMVCGSLQWRPHIWISGRAGAGKSWTMENIVARVLDRFALSALSATTEAGMRQTIRSDAMPVIMDEAESEDEKSRARFKSILDLVRQSSSESGGAIIKGTMHGTAMEFRVRSCFCFASIGVAAVARADVSRITVLGLEKRPDNADQFARVQALAADSVLQPGYCAALRARAISLALTIRRNSITFSQAVTLKVKDARTGDQLGSLLAGAYALTSTAEVTLPWARDWVERQNWDTFLPGEADRDETRCLMTLSSALVRVERGSGAPMTLSIDELMAAYYDPETGAEARTAASADLVRRGVKPTAEYVDVSANHPELARIFEKTIWSGKWKDQLARCPGFLEHTKGSRFGNVVHRAVRLSPTAFGLHPLLAGE